jgi:prophage antirepressor-like protein
MENNLTIFDFHGTKVRTVQKDGEPLFCLSDLCEVLDLTAKIVNQRLSDEVVTKNPIVDSLGREQQALFVNEDGLYDVILDSRKLEARQFRKWITSEVLPSIRKTGQYSLHNRIDLLEKENQELQRMADELLIENRIDRQKLRLFEEYNDDILYDFEQVATAIRIYRKPPFGVKHLKKWLSDHRIICLPFYKNDKPKQKFIESDWFRIVMHEYKRKGIRRFESRYMITQRGFNNIIHLAIREKIIEPPIPKQNYLPNTYEEFPSEAGGTITVDPIGDGNLVKIS